MAASDVMSQQQSQVLTRLITLVTDQVHKDDLWLLGGGELGGYRTGGVDLILFIDKASMLSSRVHTESIK